MRAPKLPAMALLLTAALGASGGCTLIKGTLELPDRAIQALLPFTRQDESVDPVEVQSKLIRFSDNYLDAVVRNIGKLQRHGKPITRREMVRRRIQYTNQVIAIATGANAFANLLDMIVLVTLTRMLVEDRWAPQAKGEAMQPIILVSRDAEKEVWRISSMALKPQQQRELRSSLQTWLKQNPSFISGPEVADLDFVAEIQQFGRNRSSGPTSVFNLLMIDPLSGLDPAAKELAETRLMAERALFLSRHLPELIRWETEFLTMNTLEIPEVKKLLANSTQLAESAKSFSQLSEKLPGLLSTEREQLLATLKSERQGFTALAAESKNALAAGKQMADAANATLKSFQAVVAQMEASPSDPNSEPFRIRDYSAAAAQIGQTSQRLVELLGLFNQTIAPGNLEVLSSRVDFLTRQAETRSKGVVDYALRKALIGSALICAMVLGATLVHQWLSAWLSSIVSRRSRAEKA